MKIRNFLNQLTLKSKIRINLIIFTMIPIIIITIYINWIIKKNHMEEQFNIINENLQKCTSLIDMEFKTYIEKGTYILSNTYLNNNIDNNFQDRIEEAILFNNHLKMLFEGINPESYLSNPFSIYTDNETALFNPYINDIQTIKDNVELGKLKYMKLNNVIWTIEEEKNGVEEVSINYYRRLNMNNKTEDILRCHIPLEKIQYLLDEIGMPNNGVITYFDDKGELIYYKESPVSNPIDIDNIKNRNEKKYYTFDKKLQNGHMITVFVPTTFVKKNDINVFLIILSILLLFFLVIIYVSNFTSRKITSGLDQFIRVIQDNKEALLIEEIQDNKEDEISFIKIRFIEAIEEINSLYKKTMDYNNQLSKTEMELLQARINPHLLYNSLSVIKWSALEKEDYKSVKMIDTMTSYYRLALNKGNNIMYVRDEIKMIDQYVRINEFSRSSKFTLDTNIDNDILELFVIKHLLQPIVENAILHAFDMHSSEEKIITINGYEKDGFIIFDVIDNGEGMDENKIDEILSFNYVSNYGGYGIKNLIKRIDLYYGAGSRLNIKSEIGKGTEVKVRIKNINREELREKMKGKDIK